MKIEVFEGSAGAWGFHVLTDEGEQIMRSVKDYESMDDCATDVEMVQKSMKLADKHVSMKPLLEESEVESQSLSSSDVGDAGKVLGRK